MAEHDRIESSMRQPGHIRTDVIVNQVFSCCYSQAKQVCMHSPQPGTYFGCDCYCQKLMLPWAPAHLRSHRLRKTH